MTRARGAFASAVRRLPEFPRFHRAPVAGHAKIFVHPAYARLVRTEPYVKRLIPLLIVLFAVALGAMRGIALYQAHEEVEASGRQRLALIAKSTVTDLFGNPQRPIQIEPGEWLQGQLENSLPARATTNGRYIFVVDRSGRIVAMAPREPQTVGRYIDEFLGRAQPLTTLGERAGVLTVPLDSGEEVIATVHHGADGRGSVAVVQSKAALFAPWRRTVSREVTVFVATSLVLVILGFAFHAQAARADEADFIYGETQNRLHMALRRGYSGLWDWDLARGAIFWSPSMFELLGIVPRNHLLSVGEVADLVHPEDTDLVEIANSLVRARAGQLDREFRMRHQDGRWVWIRARAEVVCEGDDDPHLVGIAVDVTEQKRLSEASRTADIRLRDAVEAISEAFVLWDSGNRLVMCNSKYQQLYGLPDNLVRPGTPFDEVLRGGARPIIANTPVLFMSGGPGARSVEAQLDDGRWLQISERRTKDDGFVSVGTDITALKKQQEQLMENERALTATVADLRRSRQQLELQAQQLIELAEKYAVEKDRAEDANRLKSEFLANVSHELRTPLNAIIGFSEVMVSGAYGSLGDEKYVEYSRDIHESGRFLLGIISEILDMARLEAGRTQINPEPLDLAALVDDVVAENNGDAERASVAITTRTQPDLKLSADPNAVKQVLTNLVSNAIKFTPEGGTISIAASRRRDGVALVVEDTGIGIPEEALAQIGNPFVQVQSQMTRSHKGSGLGLAISRSLVLLHGGDIQIASKPGDGTRVVVFLPFSPKAQVRPAA